MLQMHTFVFAMSWRFTQEVMTKWRNKVTQLTPLICIYDIELAGVIQREAERNRERDNKERERKAMRATRLPPFMRSLCLRI